MSSEPLRTNPERFFNQNLTLRHLLTKRSSVLALGVVGLAFAGAAGWFFSQRADSATYIAPDTTLTPSTMSVELTDVYQQPYSYTGVVRSSQASDLGFELAGTIEEVVVKVGDRVKEDTVLAKLDTRKLTARQNELLAQLKVQNATLKELEAGPRQQTIAAAKARVERLDADVELAKTQQIRASQLRERGSISTEEYDRAQFGLQSVQAQREAAHLEYDELVKGTRPEKIEAQIAVVEQLEASVADIKYQLEDATLKAPYDGQVTQRYLHDGSIVSPGSPVLRVIQTSALEVWIGVPPEVVTSFTVGETQQLRFADREIEATLTSILDELDRATRTQTLVFEIQGEDHGLAIGDLARLQVVIDKDVPVQSATAGTAKGFWVPVEALTRGPRGLWSVFTIQLDPDTAEHVVRRAEVTTIYPTEDRVFVRGALKNGDLVIRTGLQNYVPGQVVSL